MACQELKNIHLVDCIRIDVISTGNDWKTGSLTEVSRIYLRLGCLPPSQDMSDNPH
jgi:hypothetical protein